jgi:molybdopterin/thiamine biosynthesis adenylyltransferase
MGSHIVYTLAGTVPLVIDLIDPDKVDAKHTQGMRTIYTASQVNQKKVDAAKHRIESDYPNSVINPLSSNVMDIPEAELRALASRAMVIISAIDDPDGLLYINRTLYPVIEVLYPACHAAAATGHIIATIPFVSSCLRCAMDITSPTDITALHAEPGLGLDFRNIANQTAIIALEIMFSKATGRAIQRWDVTKNIFYFSNSMDPQLSPDGPGVHLQRAEKRPGCPICSAGPDNFLSRR